MDSWFDRWKAGLMMPFPIPEEKIVITLLSQTGLVKPGFFHPDFKVIIVFIGDDFYSRRFETQKSQETSGDIR